MDRRVYHVLSGVCRPSAGEVAERMVHACCARLRRCFDAAVNVVFVAYGMAIANSGYVLGVTYTTVTRVNSAFPFVSSVSNITSAIVHQYCGDVEGEINLYVGKRYTLPLSGDVPILTAIATRETIYRLGTQRSLIHFPAAQQGKAPLQVQHEDDQEMLKAIAAGELPLITTSGELLSPNLALMPITTNTKAYNPTFHEGPWTEQLQDPQKLLDIASERAGYE